MIGMVQDRAVHLIKQERVRQAQAIAALNLPYDVSDPRTADHFKMLVLLEEVGEVAKHVLTYPDGDANQDLDLLEEVTQVAAVAMAWVEALVEKRDA